MSSEIITFFYFLNFASIVLYIIVGSGIAYYLTRYGKDRYEEDVILVVRAFWPFFALVVIVFAPAYAAMRLAKRHKK